MLGQQQQLNFDEGAGSEAGTSPLASADKKKPPVLEEPKHEKRDSGIACLDENPDVKILEEAGGKLSLLNPLSPMEGDNKFPSSDGEQERSPGEEGSKVDEGDDDDDETEGEGPGDDGGDTTEDEEGVITNIDDVLEEEEEKSPVVNVIVQTPPISVLPGPMIPPKAASTSDVPKVPPTGTGRVFPREQRIASTPSRPLSDYSALIKSASDHTHSSSSSSISRTLSEHAHSPLSSSLKAGRFKRRTARMEDISQLNIMAHDLDITVSPPTPGEARVKVLGVVL